MAYSPTHLGGPCTLPRVLSGADAERLARASLTAPAHLRATHELLLWTGLRASEAVALLWADVDQAACTVRVQCGKGHKTRVVPVPRSLLPRIRNDADRRSPWVLPNARDPTRPITRRALHRRVAALADAAGIYCHPHTLRHCYACNCLRAGLTIAEVSALLGHASIATTAIYLHVQPDALAARVQALLEPSMAPRLAL